MIEQTFKIVPSIKRQKEISDFVKGYWENDIWNFRDSFFDKYRSNDLGSHFRIDFNNLPHSLRNELKFMLAKSLIDNDNKLISICGYGHALKHISSFIKTYYPKINSLVLIPHKKALLQYRTYLLNKGYKINKKTNKLATHNFERLFNQICTFFENFYDERDELNKDIWDFRKIPGARFNQAGSDYNLSFMDIPQPFRNLVKRYMKVRIIQCTMTNCKHDLLSLKLFLSFFHVKYPNWKNLRLLTRKHMEDYLSWYRVKSKDWTRANFVYLRLLRKFLEYIQLAQYPEAPETPAVLLIFNEDIPKDLSKQEYKIKYMPEGVLRQLEDNLENLTPPEYIPIVILLRATGWRISDIFNLRYDTCLEQTTQGWYLCGDIVKTSVLNHRVPITEEVASIVKDAITNVKEKSNNRNNPRKLLFVRYTGKRMGRCPNSTQIRDSLNRLAQKYNIVDDFGNIFKFGNHAFRHTKAVELINNGMNLLHVQKWLAHSSPEMTLHYAKIFDTTLRRSWEEATRNGLFRIDLTGNVVKINLEDIQNEDLIEWEYIRHNLDAVRMPLGYCMKPNKLECKHQLNPCLTCRNLCTTPDFIPQYELEIKEIKDVIELGKIQGRIMWVEKNNALLERYETIIAVLKNGKIHHQAGKKGREYVGVERIHVH